MSKKKVTAPLSYDPGKGRPKEYLAYLNWQEMQALQRLNGGNMERGPNGLPSFAITTGTTTGTTVSTGGGSTSGIGDREGGGSESGGSMGGTTSPGATASTTGTTTESQSADTTAQQEAATKNAADAARTSALTEDARKGGIGSINVGPMQTPVKIAGGQITGTISQMATDTYGAGIPGQAYPNLADRTPSNVLSTPYNTVFQERMPVSGRIQDVVGDYRSNRTRLHSGVDIAVKEGSPVTPRAPGTVVQVAKSAGAYGPTVQVMATDGTIDRYALHKDQKISLQPGDPVYQDTVIGLAGKLPKSKGGTFSHLHYEAITQKDPAYSKIVNSMRSGQLGEITDRVIGSTSNPILGNVRAARAAPKTSTMDVMNRFGLGSGDPVTAGQTPSISTSNYASVENVTKPVTQPSVGIGALRNAFDTPQTVVAEKEIENVEEQYRNPTGVSASVIPSKYNYPVKPDGAPYTAEDLQNLPPDILNDYMDKVRFARMTDEKYPMTAEQMEKAFVAKGLGRVITANPFARAFVTTTNLIGKGIGALPGEMGDEFGSGLAGAGEALKDPGAAVEAYATANPLRKVQMEVLAGEPNYVPGTRPPSTGSAYAGGVPTQEPGGKGNQLDSYSSQASYGQPIGPTAALEESGRPQQYYLWDLGVGIPSPGDPDYNEYQKYRRNRGSSANV